MNNKGVLHATIVIIYVNPANNSAIKLAIGLKATHRHYPEVDDNIRL